MNTILLMIAGALLSAGAGALISWFFHHRASRDLEKHTSDLKRISGMLARRLEDANTSILFDPKTGEMIDNDHRLSGTSTGSSDASAAPSVIREEDHNP